MTTDELIVSGYRMIGRMTGTLLAIVNSMDHDDAKDEARIMLRELADGGCTLPDELRRECRKAAGRRTRA